MERTREREALVDAMKNAMVNAAEAQPMSREELVELAVDLFPETGFGDEEMMQLIEAAHEEAAAEGALRPVPEAEDLWTARPPTPI